MLDPVTLSTGMTYDRASIEKWLQSGRNTCPTTNQILQSRDLIPNHTLRRAIQSWCDANKGSGVDRIPTPRQVVDSETVQYLLASITQCTDASSYYVALNRLRSVSEECGRNRKILTEAGAVPVLTEALIRLESELLTTDSALRIHRSACECVVGIIASLQLEDSDKQALATATIVTKLSSLLVSGNSQTRNSAAELIHSACGDDSRLKSIVGNHPGAIKALVSHLRDDPRALTAKETKALLRCLLSLALPKKNRIIAIESRAVNALVELIPRSERRNVEYSFAILEILANCAEGRESITNHPFAIPRMVDSLLGVSNQATEHAVAALWVVISLASNRSVINTALRAGAFTKLLMVLPSDCSHRAKLKARDTLKLLNEVWGTYTSRLEEDLSVVIARGSVRPSVAES